MYKSVKLNIKRIQQNLILNIYNKLKIHYFAKHRGKKDSQVKQHALISLQRNPTSTFSGHILQSLHIINATSSDFAALQ